MAYGFLEIASTPSVKAAQAANGSAEMWSRFSADRKSDRFTADEVAFIAERDSFYIASVGESGWPYVQHRGGPTGFLRVLDERTLAFADYRGNRQYITVGNAAADDRVALFLMDYPARRRLKIFAHLDIKKLEEDAALAARVVAPDYKAKTERTMLLHLEAFDWNCPQHITPRFTEAQVEKAAAPLRDKLQSLELDNARLRAALAERAASQLKEHT